MASVRKVPRVRSSVTFARSRAESRLTELLGLSPRTNSEVLVPAECVD